jgi:hypothetical protein
MRSVYQLVGAAALFSLGVAHASSMGGVVQGTVTDPSGAVVQAATISIRNPITGFERSAVTDANGRYTILGVPFNQYHFAASKDGFALFERDVPVRSAVPVEMDVRFDIAGTAASVSVEAATADILENVPFAHYDADRATFSRLPMVTPASSLSDTVTMLTPGVVASSNGFFHPLGDHAQTSFVVDGQPVNDQQSKQFSTQLPANALQAMELITGGVNAEFGDKTSLVVNTQTRSGLDAGTHGNLNVYYGSFGTIGEDATLSTGSKTFGNFLAANSVRTGRFLDTPEFQPINAIGNAIQIFDRMDFRPNERHAFNLNIFGARNWFQVPNSLDNLNQDQRQRSTTFSANSGYRNTTGANSLGSGRTAWATSPAPTSMTISRPPCSRAAISPTGACAWTGRWFAASIMPRRGSCGPRRSSAKTSSWSGRTSRRFNSPAAATSIKSLGTGKIRCGSGTCSSTRDSALITTAVPATPTACNPARALRT